MKKTRTLHRAREHERAVTEQIEQERRACKIALIEQARAEMPQEPAKGDGVTRIGIRLSTGDRIVRYFNATDRIRASADPRIP